MLYFEIVLWSIIPKEDIQKKELFSIQGYVWLIVVDNSGLLGMFDIWELNTSPSRGYTNCGFVMMTIKGYSGAGHILLCGIFLKKHFKLLHQSALFDCYNYNVVYMFCWLTLI